MQPVSGLFLHVATPTHLSGDSRQVAPKAQEVARKKNSSERLEAVVPNLSFGTHNELGLNIFRLKEKLSLKPSHPGRTTRILICVSRSGLFLHHLLNRPLVTIAVFSGILSLNTHTAQAGG
jgi:hypothetical protein